MKLSELIDGLPARRTGTDDPEITDLAYDSRRVGPGTAFVCVTGMSTDGHEFAPQAVAAGASALVVERELPLEAPQVLVDDARASMAPLAARLFGDPSAALRVAAITGTNGKTTTAFLVRSILEAAGIRCGLLGTVKQIVGGVEEPVERTTPEAIDLQRTFRRMLDADDRACAIEASSHALALGRADHLHVEVACFTNLTQDHLDFHPDMADYFAAKRRIFFPPPGRGEPPSAAAVNVDDGYGAGLAAELAEAEPRLITYSAGGAQASLRALEVDFDAGGSSFVLEARDRRIPVRLSLPGHFNVENGLAALAVAEGMGLDLAAAAEALEEAEPVPGRLEPIDEGQPFAVLVDYAHTPDSLENVLRAARRLGEGRLIAVFGAGGDRDRSKRPLMGRAGAELADLAVVTSDNPRSERPEAIIEEILAGIPDREEVEVEVDRRAAIALALEAAEPGDLVVIAGKGHEQGQEFEGGRKIPFDDRDVAREELGRLRAAR